VPNGQERFLPESGELHPNRNPGKKSELDTTKQAPSGSDWGRHAAMPLRAAGAPSTCRPPPDAAPVAPAIAAAVLGPASAAGAGARRRNAGEPGPAAAGTRRAAYPGSRLRVLIKPHPCPSRREGGEQEGVCRGEQGTCRSPPCRATALPGQVLGNGGRRWDFGLLPLLPLRICGAVVWSRSCPVQ